MYIKAAYFQLYVHRFPVFHFQHHVRSAGTESCILDTGASETIIHSKPADDASPPQHKRTISGDLHICFQYASFVYEISAANSQVLLCSIGSFDNPSPAQARLMEQPVKVKALRLADAYESRRF